MNVETKLKQLDLEWNQMKKTDSILKSIPYTSFIAGWNNKENSANLFFYDRDDKFVIVYLDMEEDEKYEKEYENKNSAIQTLKKYEKYGINYNKTKELTEMYEQVIKSLSNKDYVQAKEQYQEILINKIFDKTLAMKEKVLKDIQMGKGLNN